MNGRHVLSAMVLLALFLHVPGFAGENVASWRQWRGPQRNGVLPHSPSLAEKWGSEGPPLLWEITDIPSAGAGGYGSPTVAEGRAYLFVNRRYEVPIPTRTITNDTLHRHGWTQQPPPAELVEAVEQARQSAEREPLAGDDLKEWIDAFIKSKLPTKEDEKRYGHFVRTRLQQGKEALPLEVLKKLEAKRGEPFATAAAFEKWLDEQEITGELRNKVTQGVATADQKANDQVYCIDLASGNQLWKKEWPGLANDASSTPAIVDGRVYGMASTGEAYCLDARSGEEFWRTKCHGGHSSFLVMDGRAIVLSKELTALDAESGAVIWKQPKVGGRDSSPAAWKSGDQTYLLCNTNGQVHCVDFATGDVRWTAPGGSPSTVAVEGDFMTVLTDNGDLGLVGYRLTPESAQQVWNVPKLTDRGASPVIHDGHVYAIGGQRTVCVDMQSGKVAWEGKPGKGDIGSPLVADGKLIAPLSNMFIAVMDTTAKRYRLLDKIRISLAPCTSPAVTDGKLVIRTPESLACYDLTATADAQVASEEAPAGE